MTIVLTEILVIHKDRGEQRDKYAEQSDYRSIIGCFEGSKKVADDFRVMT